MKILKASAGSGKTYRLSRKYRELLLAGDDPYSYRHILAVTFTNKATAEMKTRILKDLSEQAKDNSRAREVLVNLLHDYGAFSISTIDKFFQRTLKAFSREIGQFADYQIELDKESVVTESMDRVLDSLTEDSTELLEWIRESMASALASGQKFSVDKKLYDMGVKLKSEEHRRLAEQHSLIDSQIYSKDNLGALRKNCRTIISDFEKKVSPYVEGYEKGKKIECPKPRAMSKLPSEIQDMFGKPYSLYCTAKTLEELIFSLGVAGEFYREYDALLKEKKLMCLDDSNTVLRDIIDGSDAPFVYEKLGVRYNHFLLDEFQDTSNIQWQNFLPLLRESDSKGGDNLIVGDVKQCIYRFRDSDWTLLGSKVREDFPDAEEEPLDGNWRSTSRVVNFNNGFFSFAAQRLGLSDIYKDVNQIVRLDDDQQGCVRVTFTDNQMDAVLESVRSAFERGALPGEIAVLVRGNKEGSAVAGHLVSNGIPVISDDSLKLKSSLTVRRLVSLLSCLDNPDDGIGRYLSDSMSISLPDKYHSLVDLCESLLREIRDYDPATFAGETLFIQAFMDDLQSWTDINGNNLRLYLKRWNDKDPAIGCPETSSAVRIITVHKSKGLEFPYVIFPFADKVKLYMPEVHWCHLDQDGPLNGLYPVNLTKDSLQSSFAPYYESQRSLQSVDNINIFYVALTRAGKQLHVIAAEPPKAFKENMSKDPTNMSQLLYAYCEQMGSTTFGKDYDFSRMDRAGSSQAASVGEFAAEYASIPLDGRLKPSSDSADFFGEDGTTGPAASARLAGLALHGILSKVNRPDDLKPAVDDSVRSGALSAAQGEEALSLLAAAIDSRSEWFSSDGRNELSLFDRFGKEKRPDRVVITQQGVDIIDYKFGDFEPGYEKQVRGYMNIYRSLGYKNVRGYLWFVRTGEVRDVI